MSAHRCPGCGAAAQKTIEGNRLRWLEPEPHETGTFILLGVAVLPNDEVERTPASRYAGMLDDGPRFHLHTCDPSTAVAYADSLRRDPTRRARRLAEQRHAAKSVKRAP